MRTLTNSVLVIAISAIFLSGCSTMTNTQKGAAIGVAGGAAMGAIIGKATGNAGLGAILGAAVGGTSGVLIGKKMDKQAEEIDEEVPGANVDRVGEGIVVEFNNAVLFGFDKSDLSVSAKTELDKLVVILNKYPDTNLEVAGHTDSKGATDYNQRLSERRAASVAEYVISKGIVANRFTTIGYGELAPKYENDTDENMAKNRRVEFVITANEKMKEDAKKEAGEN